MAPWFVPQCPAGRNTLPALGVPWFVAWYPAARSAAKAFGAPCWVLGAAPVACRTVAPVATGVPLCVTTLDEDACSTIVTGATRVAAMVGMPYRVPRGPGGCRTASYPSSAAVAPWLVPRCPVAFQSVRRFALDGESGDAHALTVSVGFDSDVGYAQTHTFAAGSPVTTFGPLESCDVIIGTRRKCQRVRFRIQDASPGPGNFTTGRGPSFSAMGLEVGAKKGFRKKPSTQVA